MKRLLKFMNNAAQLLTLIDIEKLANTLGVFFLLFLYTYANFLIKNGQVEDG